jgi:hypothetical protein
VDWNGKQNPIMKKLYVKEASVEGPVDWQKATFAPFPNPKPTGTAISPCVPNGFVAPLEAQPHRRGMPYQSYVKSVLAARLKQGQLPEFCGLPQKWALVRNGDIMLVQSVP